MKFWPLVCVLALAGCVSRIPVAAPTGAAGQPLRDVAKAVDLSPDPHIVEINLTAAPAQYEFVSGHPTTVWAYNGMVPGPLIECNQGDQLIVHFTNHLPVATTVHWHGVRLPAAMDGSHLSQDPVPPGGTFTYTFTVPDASLFWYHPHHDTQEELYRGLYGPLLVHGADEPALPSAHVMMLSDVGLDAGGQLIEPADLTQDVYQRATGVEGNTELINGQALPTLTLAPGSTQRWRVVNAASARYFDLALPGAQLTLIGTDGGLIDKPYPLEHLMLTPGERADLVVQLPAAAPAQPLALINRSYQRMRIDDHPADPQSTLATLSVTGAAAEPQALPSTLADIPQLTTDLPDRGFGLTVALQPPGTDTSNPMDDMHGASADDFKDMTLKFLINQRAYPDIPRFTAKLGTTEQWVVRNHSDIDHPFHLHGFRFQVVDINGVAPPYRAWKDTLNISEPGDGGDGLVRLLVEFDGYPGEWVYHCHVLFHQEHGMMGEFTVAP